MMAWQRFFRKSVPIMFYLIICLWMTPLLQLTDLSVPNAGIGLTVVMADNHYGILGQAAPELDLDTWIDGDGKAIAPLHLREYRNKVIYLYFFQDW